MAPSNTQWDDAVRNYCLKILKVKKVAVIGDTTGYGVTALDASVAAFKKDGADVVYQANIDATQPDMTPGHAARQERGRRGDRGLERLDRHGRADVQHRAAMGWDVPFVGHPSMSSGEIAGLVEKPANWEKVYAIGYRSCSYDAAGKLPPQSQDLVERLARARSS